MNVETLFHEALAQPPAERAAFLDAACAGQPKLRAEIDALLKAHDDSAELPPLDACTGMFAPDSAEPPPKAADQASAVIAGRYKLLEEIGEGGMGTVWVAEQTEPVRRKVALKLIKAGMDSRSVLARFEAERQALALMDHPNIAKVLDGGLTDDRRPFFVMEYVKGVPVTEYCDAARLSVPERLGLFVQVCQAVQHAHQKGIIHRDLKPSNILVAPYDDRPVPKVIDFGLAKALHQPLTERTLHTAHETVLGTPLYMSPEQAQLNNLDVDTRTDIYSLGVLLYELLTGTTPLERKRFKEAAWDEIRRVIKEEEPPRPSARLSSTDTLPSLAASRQLEPAKLTRLVRGELDWIVMKALEKDRSRRYETANGFAMDVQRYLAGDPVLAAPPSASYRLRKFARRNRTPVLAASLVFLALLLGTVGTGFGLIRAEIRRKEAEHAQALAVGEKKRAEDAEAQMLADYRASSDDAIELLIGSKPELGPQDRAYLETTLARWQALAARQGDDERSRVLRAEGHFRVGRLWQQLGRPPDARVEYEAARELWKKLVELYPAVPQYQTDLGKTLTNLGKLLRNLGQHERARDELEKACDLHKKLTERYPAVPEYQHDLALPHINLGFLLCDNLGEREVARREFEVARDLLKPLADKNHAVPAYRYHLAMSHSGLANVLAVLGQREAALAEYEKARDLQNKLAEEQPTVPMYRSELALTRNNLGMLLADIGQWDGARAEYEAAVRLLKQLAEQYPAVPRYRYDLAVFRTRLGILLPDLGQRDAARAEYEAAIGLLKKLLEQHPAAPDYRYELSGTHTNLGNVLSALGQRDAARAEYGKARDLLKQLVDQYPTVPDYRSGLAYAHNNLGIELRALGQGEAARAEYEKALDLKKQLAEQFPAVPRYEYDVATTRGSLANVFADLGQRDEARAEYEKARDVLKHLTEKYPAVPEYRYRLAIAYTNLGGILNGLGQRQAARIEFETAYNLQKELAEQNPNVERFQVYFIEDMANLGRFYLDNGQQQEGFALIEEALERAKKKSGPLPPAVAAVKWPLTHAYDKAGLYAKAELMYRGFLAEGKSFWGSDDGRTVDLMTELGQNLSRQQKWEEAERLLRDGLAFYEKKNPDYFGCFNVKSLLGGVLLGREKYAEAEPLLLAGYEGLSKDAAKNPTLYLPGADRHPRLIDAIGRLVALYDATGKQDEAPKWRKELEAVKAAPRKAEK
jgi:serine/threonine protein kinase/tetratricopeptide (TPR) repeat protein